MTKADDIAALQAQLAALQAEPEVAEKTTADLINDSPAEFVSQLHHRLAHVEAFIQSRHRLEFQPLPMLPDPASETVSEGA